jgi:mono/diheme cytochrome c family protein
MLILAACTLLHACASRKSEPLTGEVFTTTDTHVVNGEKMYMLHCQKCHPGGGEGGLGPAINSNPAPGFVKRFQVRHGLGVMPGFDRSEISESDLKDIANFMEAWNR